jgi:triacylglycerol lipase
LTRRRRLLRAWSLGLAPVFLLVAALAVVAVQRRIAAGGSVSGVAQDRQGTVLLVAGYGGSTGSLDQLAGRLRASGRQVDVVPPVGENTGDLLPQARALDQVARRDIAAGAPSVDVVGYSAGGVVARIWAADLGGAELARRMVTLGSPHHGTQVAQLAAGLLPGACPTACQQLAPGSDLLLGLPQTPGAPGWTSIWTADDDIVTPPSSAVLQGAVDVELQTVCADDRVAHGGLPTDPLVIGLVRLALSGPVLQQPPGPDHCAALRAAGSG